MFGSVEDDPQYHPHGYGMAQKPDQSTTVILQQANPTIMGVTLYVQDIGLEDIIIGMMMIAQTKETLSVKKLLSSLILLYES